MSQSDLDVEAYNELLEESKTTGKSINQILAERKGLVYKKPDGKMVDEVKKTLAENSWKQPKKSNE